MSIYGPYVDRVQGDAVVRVSRDLAAAGGTGGTAEVLVRLRELRDVAHEAYDSADLPLGRRSAWERYEFLVELCRLSPRRISGVLTASDNAGGSPPS